MILWLNHCTILLATSLVLRAFGCARYALSTTGFVSELFKDVFDNFLVKDVVSLFLMRLGDKASDRRENVLLPPGGSHLRTQLFGLPLRPSARVA